MASANNQPSKSTLKRVGALALNLCLWFPILLGATWALGALFYHGLLPFWIAKPLSVAMLVGVGYIFLRFKNRWLAKATVFALVLLVYFSWIWVAPRNDRNWVDQHQKHAQISFDQGQVSIENLRHTKYVSEEDYQTEYEDIEFELEQIQGVWFFVQRFTALQSLGHTFISFEVETENGTKFISVSVEVRCEKNEGYGPIKGMFKQFELFYTLSNERDALGYRTHVRKNDRVWMYRCNASPQQAQRLFEDIARRQRKLQSEPEYYDTFLSNCTNNIVLHVNKLADRPLSYFDMKIVFPGFSAKSAYNLGLIGTPGERFADLQNRSRVDEIARAVPLDDKFSETVRKLLSEQQSTSD